VELEYISQARSDHCNHNTFQGLFRYRDADAGKPKSSTTFSNPASRPRPWLCKKKPWVVSVLWDNAGVGRFDDDHYYVITGETHNSPSNMEAYGGAITGIVGSIGIPGHRQGLPAGHGQLRVLRGARDYAGDQAPAASRGACWTASSKG
jgi:phosphoribosylformylglycinamidine synthase subunit PurSL